MTKLHRSVAALLIAALLLPGALMAEKLPEIKFEKFTLPNGLQVILHEDHSLPTVAVNIWYHVGSKNEAAGKTGYAHLFEHMMFKGSEHHPDDYSFEAIGGEDNASTSEDRTNYYETVPSNYLELALWMESDRMGYLPAAMTKEKVDIQRDVVKNERRQRMDNQPYAKASEMLSTALYAPGHPYSWPIIGSMEDLSVASVEDIVAFFKMYYAPNNASMCIAGDFNPAEAKALVEKYFSSIPSGPPIDRPAAFVPQLDGLKRLKAQDRVNLPRVYYAWHTPAYYTPGDAEFDMLSSIMTAGKTSRLYKALVYDQQIAQDVAAYQSSNELCSTFRIQVTAKPGHTAEEIEKATDAILKDILEKGVTAEELKVAQTSYEASMIRSLERLGGNGSVSDALNEYNTMLGDPGKHQWDLDRHMVVTPADIQRYAKQYLDLNRRVIAYILPQGDLKASEDKLDRKVQPAAAAEPTFTPPQVQTATLSNGTKLLLVEKHTLPLIQANIVFKSGWASDPVDKPLTARLTAELMDEGTKTRNALQISEDARSIGAMVGSSSSMDGSTVSVNVLKKNLDQGLAQMTDVLLNPTFPKDELDRQKKSYLARLMQEKKEPGALANKAFAKLMYGPGHPYATTGTGTEASINALTREDLEAFYKANFVPNNAAIIVVGDLTLAEATEKFEKALKDWKPGTPTVREIPDPQPLKATKIVIVDKPGAPQSVIFVGNPGIKRSDPDVYGLNVINNTLGGTFGSRLNQNLREQKGYTYGAHSAFVTRRGTGVFVASSMVKTDVTDKAVTEFVKELKDITGTRPLSDKELKESKDNLIKGYPQNFDSYNAIAGYLNGNYLYDLPATEWSDYPAKTTAINAEMAASVAKKHIQPDALLIVIVGDREVIEPALKKLNLGEVSSVNIADL
jgi:zinc protease